MKSLTARTTVTSERVSCHRELLDALGDGDDADLQEVYDTERHLLCVACTRARDHLLVTSVEPASEFVDDMQV